MEAAPKLQMMSFDFIVPPDKEKRYPDLSGSVERFILARHQDDPGIYTDELRQLRDLQRQAYQTPRTVQGLETLKRYLGQLKMLQARFPLNSSDAACADLQFTWYDAFSGEKLQANDVRLEEACIMHNIGALHSYLGADSPRTTAEQMKQSCSHFQFAAWAFEQVKSMYTPIDTTDSASIPSLSKGYLNYARHLMLAQAQECILEKSLLDSRKAMTIAKVAAQVVQYYREAEQISTEQCSGLRTASSAAAAALFADLVSLIDCIPTKYLQFKQSYYNVITNYACGCHADDAQKMGERVAYFAEAQRELEAATKTLHKTDEAARCAEALQFVGDVVGQKLQCAKKDNDFIYHEKVPKIVTLQPIACANLVKPVSFDVTDEKSIDIFHALVPMPVYEQLSVYSEKKAEKLREILRQVEFKNDTLAEFMSSIDIDTLKNYRKSSGKGEETARQHANLPQELLDACADMSSTSKSSENLKTQLEELHATSTQLEEKLREVRKLILERGLPAETELAAAAAVNKRAPILSTLKFAELLQQLEQYERAQAQANSSNLEADKLFADQPILADWKLMSSGRVDDVARNVPKFSLLDAPNVDEELGQLDVLLEKVHEMKRQRDDFVEQLRKSMDGDDIRQAIMLAMSPKETSANFDAVFERELKKFQPQIDLLDQNMRAQQKIVDAIVDANAKCSELRQYVVGTLGSREKRIKRFLNAASIFDELQKKLDSGMKFYGDFKKRIVKLDEQVKERLQQFENFKATQQQEAAAVAEQNRVRPPPQNVTGLPPPPPVAISQPNAGTLTASPQPAVSANSAAAFAAAATGGMTLGDYMKQMKLAPHGVPSNNRVIMPPTRHERFPPEAYRQNNDAVSGREAAAAQAAQMALNSLPSPSVRTNGSSAAAVGGLIQQYNPQRDVGNPSIHQSTASSAHGFNAASFAPLPAQQFRTAPSFASVPSQPLMPTNGVVPFSAVSFSAANSTPNNYYYMQQPNPSLPLPPAASAAPALFQQLSGPFASSFNPASAAAFDPPSTYRPYITNNSNASYIVPPTAARANGNAAPTTEHTLSSYQQQRQRQPYQPSQQQYTAVVSASYRNVGEVNVPVMPNGNYSSNNAFAWQPANVPQQQPQQSQQPQQPQQMPLLLMPSGHPAPQQSSSSYSGNAFVSQPIIEYNMNKPVAPPAMLQPQPVEQPPQQQRTSAYSSLIGNKNDSMKFQAGEGGGKVGGSLVSSYAQLLTGGGEGKNVVASAPPALPQPQQVNHGNNSMPQYQQHAAGYHPQYSAPSQANMQQHQQYYHSVSTSNGQLAFQPPNPSNGHYAGNFASNANGYANGYNYEQQQPQHPHANGSEKSVAAFNGGTSNSSNNGVQNTAFSSDLDQLMGWSATTSTAAETSTAKKPSVFMVDPVAMPHAPPDPNSLI